MNAIITLPPPINNGKPSYVQKEKKIFEAIQS
jgi:hypothetical protein